MHISYCFVNSTLNMKYHTLLQRVLTIRLLSKTEKFSFNIICLKMPLTSEKIVMSYWVHLFRHFFSPSLVSSIEIFIYLVCRTIKLSELTTTNSPHLQQVIMSDLAEILHWMFFLKQPRWGFVPPPGLEPRSSSMRWTRSPLQHGATPEKNPYPNVQTVWLEEWILNDW